MIDDVSRLGDARQGFRPDFVVGLVLNNIAKAYYYEDVESVNVINDSLGETPVVEWAENNDFTAYVRRLGDQVLSQEIISTPGTEFDRDIIKDKGLKETDIVIYIRILLFEMSEGG